jgi:hypothetical protein
MGQRGGAGRRRRGVSWKKRRVPDLYAGCWLLGGLVGASDELPDCPLGMRARLSVGKDGSAHAT